jgi:CheY-like chemotaxis protein
MSGTKTQALLLVEDDPNDIHFFRRGLEKAGLADGLQVAEDGEEAIAYLEGRGSYGNRAEYPLPALIVLDLKLPKRGGLEVLRWLRRESSLREIPVIILTSSQEASDIARAQELGVMAYHIKPVEFKDTCNLVKSLGLHWARLSGTAAGLEPIAGGDSLV